ncbi:MAG: hypothetical protein M3383_07540 [Actinomycetota bacterium]|nr:hypothetical protein [Actinomycetota bacterium]
MKAALYAPWPTQVTAAGGRPQALEGVAVSAVREEWLVDDRWWSEAPIRRHYFELVLADGRCLVVFRERGRWFEQRA